MRYRLVKLVAWTEQVGGNEKCKMLAILGRVHLGMDKSCLFSDAVWSVRSFWVAVPQRLLTKGNRSEFRVRTHGAKQHRFFDADSSGGFNRVCSHQQVVEVQLSGRDLVVADSSDARR